MDSTLFLQQLVDSFSLGGMYAPIAVGYTMVYGVLRLINFAHGDIMMVSVYAVLFCITSLNVLFLGALSLAIIFAMVVGVATDKIAYKPLRKAPRISLLVTAIDIGFFLQNLFNTLFTSTPKAFLPPAYFEELINMGGVSVTFGSLFVPPTTFIIVVVVPLILYKDKYGIAIRALAFDVQTVDLMGIDANHIIAMVFALGPALAAVGGVFWASMYYSITPTTGTLIGLKAFAAAVLGGIGSVVGVVIGGLIIGLTEVIAVAFSPELSGFKDVFALILLVFILLFKSIGILGINFEKSRF